MEPQLLTVREFAKAINQGERFVRKLIATGEVVSVKAGGSRRIPSREVARYIDRLMQEAEDARPVGGRG